MKSLSLGPFEETENPSVQGEQKEFQRDRVPGGETPVKPRDAATIVLIRPAAPNFQVLLLERPQTSRFAAGAFVFPGGALDRDDTDSAWAGRLPPVSEQAACAAALRELFEETGVLPAAGVGPKDQSVEQARDELLDGRRLFSTLAQKMEWDFSKARIAYFARWITPRSLSMRFDTRFFLLIVATNTVVSLTGEHDSALWITPEHAMEEFGAGELPLLFPTRKTLERLAGFTSLHDAFEVLRGKSVEPILAKLDLSGDRIRPLMPGDEGYEEAL